MFWQTTKHVKLVSECTAQHNWSPCTVKKNHSHHVWEKVNAKVFAMDGNTAYTYLYTDIHDFSYETKEQNEILHTHTHTHQKLWHLATHTNTHTNTLYLINSPSLSQFFVFVVFLPVHALIWFSWQKRNNGKAGPIHLLTSHSSLAGLRAFLIWGSSLQAHAKSRVIYSKKKFFLSKWTVKKKFNEYNKIKTKNT